MWNIFMDWLITSSADPDKNSATITGIVIAYAGSIVSALSIFNISVTYETVVHYISTGGVILGCLLAIFGLCRKVYFMFKK